MKPSITFVKAALGAALLALAAMPAAAQATWPDKPIRLIVPFAPGGPGDVSARLVAEALAKRLGQPFVVDNKPGGGGVIGADALAKAAPDGYTFLAHANGLLVNNLLRPKLPYAPKDIVPVAGINSSPSVIVAGKDLPARNLAELKTLAKAQKDGLLFATTGPGSTAHFVGAMLSASFGAPFAFVPYKSGTESSTAVGTGQVAVTSEATLAAMPLIQAGKLKALAVTAEKRFGGLPDVPTTTEQGAGTVRMTHWLGLFAPRGTPPAVLDRMSEAMLAVLASSEVKARMAALGADPMPADRSAFTAFVQGQEELLAKLARDNKIVLD